MPHNLAKPGGSTILKTPESRFFHVMYFVYLCIESLRSCCKKSHSSRPSEIHIAGFLSISAPTTDAESSNENLLVFGSVELAFSDEGKNICPDEDFVIKRGEYGGELVDEANGMELGEGAVSGASSPSESD